MEVAQLCLTLCVPLDYTVYGILQARILEGVAVPFSRGSSQPRDQTQVSHIAGGSIAVDLPDPGLEPRLLHCRWILYQLSYQGGCLR